MLFDPDFFSPPSSHYYYFVQLPSSVYSSVLLLQQSGSILLDKDSCLDMINELYRFYAPLGDLRNGGPSIWTIFDWDQRRFFTVETDHVQEDDEVAIGHLRKHVEALDDRVVGLIVDPEGQLISTSEDPSYDGTICSYYPTLEILKESHPGPLRTVLRSDLLEEDRIGRRVDLVSYTVDGEVKKVVFKYNLFGPMAPRTWDEISLWSRLPSHPNIVSFDRIVLDEVHGKVVGFTSQYIPGGPLDENMTRVFKLQWLKQLIRVVDVLNYELGIMHQDIAPRNLLINPDTDCIMLFDFDISVQIGSPRHHGHRDDVKGVAFTTYEMITQDFHYRQVDYPEQNVADIKDVEWVRHPDTLLDSPISEYQSVLNKWMETRNDRHPSSQIDTSKHIVWPEFTKPPPVGIKFKHGDDDTLLFTDVPTLDQMRATMRREGDNSYVIWERPSSSYVQANGVQVWANGKIAYSRGGVLETASEGKPWGENEKIIARTTELDSFQNAILVVGDKEESGRR